MRFNVAEGPLSSPDLSVVPAVLRTVPFPNSGATVPDHSFRFSRTAGKWTINGVTFSDVNNRMLANVPFGTVELWELVNQSQGWTHPIHIHLVDFKIISRTGGATGATPRGVESYESAGLKDVVYLGKGERVVVEAHYAPWPGVYMFHCHNLIHEDNDMMASFNVTVAEDFGYNATSLIDPMQAQFRAKPFVVDDVEDRVNAFSDAEIEASIELLASYQPYDNPDWTVVP
jgi:bilirubin oxidase